MGNLGCWRVLWLCPSTVQYKDSEQVYGRILGNKNVGSSVEGNCPQGTTVMWRKSYSNEHCEVDYTNASSYNNAGNPSITEESIKYDLIPAVKGAELLLLSGISLSWLSVEFVIVLVSEITRNFYKVPKNQQMQLKQTQLSAMAKVFAGSFSL